MGSLLDGFSEGFYVLRRARRLVTAQTITRTNPITSATCIKPPSVNALTSPNIHNTKRTMPIIKRTAILISFSAFEGSALSSTHPQRASPACRTSRFHEKPGSDDRVLPASLSALFDLVFQITIASLDFAGCLLNVSFLFQIPIAGCRQLSSPCLFLR